MFSFIYPQAKIKSKALSTMATIIAKNGDNCILYVGESPISATGRLV